MNRRVLALLLGFALDAALGDPQGWPHPVRFVGKQIELEEGIVRRYLLPGTDEVGDALPLDAAQTERLGGAAIAFDVALLSPLATYGLVRLAERVHPVVSLGVETWLCYQLIAARSLRDESMAVYGRLAAGDLPGARRAVSRIVGRDTDALDEQGVARAAVETVAENTSDGVVAPLLYLGAGGAPAGMFYKAVNTLDSMMGYKNERYLNLGWAAAKLDDAVNFVPARLSGVLMCVAAGLCGKDARGAWRVFRRDRLNHSSPNAAHTEAACAGALGVQLGGASDYFGNRVEKPTIGDATRPVEAEDIQRANRLMQVTSLLGLGAAVGLAVVAGALRPLRGRLPRSRAGRGHAGRS